MKEARLNISGMTCAACSSSIERSLKRKDFIKQIEVDLVRHKAFVAYDESKADIGAIIKHIQKLGYGAEIFRKDSSEDSAPSGDYKLAIIFAIPLLIVSMGVMAIDVANEWLVCGIEIALLLPILYAGRRIYKKGALSLVRFVPSMDTLVMLGSGSAIIYSVYMVILHALGKNPHLLHSVYFESAGVIIAVIMLGKHLESTATNNAKKGLESLQNLAPKTALRFRDNDLVRVNLSDIKIGETIAIPKGEMVSLDGVALGACEVDESLITGESKHKHYPKGAKILSGSVNCGEQLYMEVAAIAEDSMIGKIIALMQGIKKAPIARVADVVSAYFVPSVITIAVLGAIVWFVVKGEAHFSFIILTSTLLISCPCALGLATPISILIATSRASKKAIYFKSGESLEGASKTDIVVFDKTGTLTNGALEVVDCAIYGASESKTREILGAIGAVERESEHLIANAIRTHIAGRGIPQSAKAQNVETATGLGISGIVNGKNVKIGNAAFVGVESRANSDNAKDSSGAENVESMAKNAPDSTNMAESKSTNAKDFVKDSANVADFAESTQNTTSAAESLAPQIARNMADSPHSIVYVAIDGAIVGHFVIADSLRPNAKNVVEKLAQIGVKSVILSGDNRAAVASVASACGIADFHASQLPQDKLTFIESLQKDGAKVAFVGDGINDALAISKADIGISLGSANDIAIKQADIILLGGDLGGIYEAIALSQKTLRNIKENLAFAFIYNVCAIPLALGIPQAFGASWTLSPMIAGTAMGLSSISVVMNAMRLNRA